MTDEIRCKHCGPTVMFRECDAGGQPRDQEIPRPARGIIEVHQMWTCTVCMSTFLFNKTEREMTPGELIRWARWLNKQAAEVA